MYAMKYMSKAVCIEKDAVRNVLREMDILMGLDNSFLVNLWFTFQDEEDLFVVVDLLLGGDFRYHLQQGIKFTEDVVIFYIGEIALALDYLRRNKIIHRDIKPDNLLLDTKGHVHLTDFNVATIMEDNTLATSMSGTKPYMAPEIFKTSIGKSRGYSYEVDWWSLGISIFEILKGKRPYHITASTNISDIIQMFESSCIMLPPSWSKNLKELMKKLLHIDPKIRLDSVEKLKECELMRSFDWEALARKDLTIPFTPSKDHLNCDPTYELEEMIIEPNPLHKKKKRLAKQCSNKVNSSKVELTPMQKKLETLSKKFKPFNREREKILLESQKTENCNDKVITVENDQQNLVDNCVNNVEDEADREGTVPSTDSNETIDAISNTQPTPVAEEITQLETQKTTVDNEDKEEKNDQPEVSEETEDYLTSFPSEKEELIELTEKAELQPSHVEEPPENDKTSQKIEEKETVEEDGKSLIENDDLGNHLSDDTSKVVQ